MARLRYLENARTGDPGTTCTHDNKLFFEDKEAYIRASDSGQLNLVADKVTITGDLTVSGTTSFDAVHVEFNQNLLEEFTVGVSGDGHNVKFHGDGTGKYWEWVADKDSNEGGVTMVGTFGITGDMTFGGTSNLSVSGTLGVTGDTTLVVATINGALTVNATTALNRKVTISPNGTGTFFDFALETEWTGGTLINAAFGGSDVTITADIVGMKLDFATNVDAVTDLDITGYEILLPDLSAAHDTTFIGFDLSAAGAITSTANTFTWKGLNIVMPTTDVSGGGAVNAYGVFVTSGTLTNNTQVGVYIDGTLTDGIKIAAACVDGIEISGDCTNFIFINEVGDNACIGIEFKAAFLGHSIETGTYQSTANGGVILTSTNTYNAGFLADDAGSNISASVRNVLARTLLTYTQSGGSIRSLMGQLKILDNIDVGTGVYTAVQGYIELAGATNVATGGKLSCIDASLEIANGETFTVDSSAYFAGVKIEATAGDGGTAYFTQDGTVAAVYIDTVGTIDDWNVGVDINDCKIGIDIEACSTANIAISGSNVTGIAMTGTYSTAAISIVSTLSNAVDYALYIDTTCSNTSVNNVPIYFEANITGAGATVHALEVQLKPTKRLGGWGTAFRAYSDLSAGGSTGSVGLLSAVCAEMNLPNTAAEGTFGVLELELGAPTSFSISADFTGVNCASYIYTNLYGAGKEYINNYGYFLNIQGLSDDTTHMLYHNTLKCAIGSTKLYLPFSTEQGSYTTAYPIVSTNLNAFAATVTMANSATNVIAATVTDSGTRTSGDARGLRVAYTISGSTLTSTAAAIGCGITFTVSANCPYVYGYKLYLNTISAKTIAQIAGVFVYMEDIGNAVQHVSAISLNRNVSNVGTLSDCFLELRNHGSTAATAFFRISGPATYLFDFEVDGQNVPVSPGSDSANCDYKVAVKVGDGSTRYLHLFSD